MKTLLRVLPYYRNYRLLLALGYLAVVGNAGFNLAVPWLIGIGVDEGVARRDTSQLILISVLIVIASALRGLCAFAQNYLGETAAQGGSFELRRALYAHVQQLSFSFHDPDDGWHEVMWVKPGAAFEDLKPPGEWEMIGLD